MPSKKPDYSPNVIPVVMPRYDMQNLPGFEKFAL